MKYKIKTDRLGLRRWRANDLPLFIELNRDARVMKYFPSVLTPEESKASLERYEKHLEDAGFGFWAVDRLDGKAFIGFIGLQYATFESDFTPCVEIGWRLSHDNWGQGFATEGARACLDYGFQELGFKEVFSFTPHSNIPSQRVMQKIGMEKVGEFPHPMLEKDSPLLVHELYRIKR
jgi:ribosomal-protein-alanine N-acetyltransferase